MLKSKSSNLYDRNVQTYKEFLNIYNKVINLAKKSYWQLSFEMAKSDIKQTWQNINYILNNKKSRHNFPHVFIYNDKKMTNQKGIANSFNEYFTSPHWK